MTPDILHLLAAIHFSCLGGLAIYGLHRLWLLFWWQKRLRQPDCKRFSPSQKQADLQLPMVTLQLPLYNERFVAARIIDAVAMMDWPQGRMEIQLLDDSTDDTSAIVSSRVKEWAEKGRSMQIIRRKRRTGYKAGALANGLTRACGEFIAVFDADFIPPPDFLKQTIPCFDDAKIGMVQTRWSFINQGASLLTRLQSLLLGPHFDIEHRVRNGRGLFFNFNGTAGIWRRQAIESAGGWQSDTVTEDLDVSYRAQLCGWQFIYRHDISVPSELPPTLSAFRSQQQRWAKGSIQTAKKLLPRILGAPVPLAVKMESAMHLLANMGWMLGALVMLTLYPTLLCRTHIGAYQMIWVDVPLFLISGGAILFYYAAYAVLSKQYRLLLSVPVLPVLTIGLAPAIGLSIARGFLEKGGRFNRTPKFGPLQKPALAKAAGLYRQPVLFHFWINMALLVYTQLPVVFAWHRGTWPAIPFLCLFPLGFALVVFFDVKSLFLKT
ncbi:MAG: glycosyltransferase family 2 protein [Thermodesulfobacteriota bacterium]